VAVAQVVLAVVLAAMAAVAPAVQYSHHPLDDKAVHLTLVGALEVATLML
jgi:hypothetical protein